MQRNLTAVKNLVCAKTTVARPADVHAASSVPAECFTPAFDAVLLLTAPSFHSQKIFT